MPPPSVLDRARRLADRLLYERVRPVAPRLSARAFDRLARLLAIPATLAALATSPRQTRAYLRLVGHPSGPLGHLRFSHRKALARFRDEYVYLRPADPVRKGPGFLAFEARGEPAVLVGWSALGMVGATRLAAERDDRVIRLPYGGEDGPAPDEVAEPWRRWEAHQGAVRHALLGPYQILPGRSPLAYLRALRQGRSLIVLQDVPDPTGAAPARRFLGAEWPLPVGAVRLARAGGVPLYVISVDFRDGELWVDLDGPHDVDEQGLLDRLAAEIRRQPWAWTLWRSFVPEPDAAPAPEAAPRLAPLAARPERRRPAPALDVPSA